MTPEMGDENRSKFDDTILEKEKHRKPGEKMFWINIISFDERLLESAIISINSSS